VNADLAVAVLRTAGWVCAGCGSRAWQADHVRPRARGGRDAPVNLAPLCGWCNLVKSDFWPAHPYHPFPDHDDIAAAERIFEAEIAWLRERHDEDEILAELWWTHRDRLLGP
jgi:hypothetical protein